MGKAFVTKKGARRVRGGHLWIYKSDVQKIEAKGGDVVAVYDEARNFVGHAFYSDSSEITLRIFTTKDEKIDEEYWRDKISEAMLRRRDFNDLAGRPLSQMPENTDSVRIVYSEGDLIPSLIVDFYHNVFVMQTL